MATEYKNIVVALAAKLGQSFTPTMKKGAASVGHLGGQVGKVAKGMSSAGKWMQRAFVAAAAGGVAIYTKSVIASMDSTGKLADRLGLTTEALGGLRHGADLAGIASADLDKGIEKWVMNLGDARNGTGAAVGALDRLGLSAAKLSAMSTEDQILAIADSMKGVASVADRAAIATDLFGKAGAELGTLLGQGSRGIRDAMREADQLGITYSRSTAAIAEGIDDSLTRIKAAFAGLGTQLIGTALPAIASAFEWVAGVMASVGQFIARILDGFRIAAYLAARALIPAVTAIEAAFVNWRDTLDIVLKAAALGIVTFANDVQYFFTEKLPAYLSWFGRNWKNLFTDLYNATTAIFSNLWTNISGFFGAVWSWIKGDGYDFEWTGLLEGFKATTEKLPEIAARMHTDLEKQLAADVFSAAGRIGTYYTEKVGERIAGLDAYAKSYLESRSEPPKSLSLPSAGSAGGAAGQAAAKSREFGILGRGMSLAALAAAGGAVDQQKQIASATLRTADGIEAMRKLMLLGEPMLIFN